jgi:hypothetical protein
MKVYHFDTFEEQGMFVDFCTANNIPVDFDTRDKTARVDDAETETDHFFDLYHEYIMEREGYGDEWMGRVQFA